MRILTSSRFICRDRHTVCHPSSVVAPCLLLITVNPTAGTIAAIYSTRLHFWKLAIKITQCSIHPFSVPALAGRRASGPKLPLAQPLSDAGNAA